MVNTDENDERANRERASRMLDSAQGVMQDYTAALRRRDWNMAVRRAQEAVELLIKGAIYATGSTASFGHGSQAATQLREMLESERYQVTEYVTSSNVPAQIQMGYKDDGSSGHAVNLFGRIITLLRMTHGVLSLVEEHVLPEEMLSLNNQWC